MMPRLDWHASSQYGLLKTTIAKLEAAMNALAPSSGLANQSYSQDGLRYYICHDTTLGLALHLRTSSFDEHWKSNSCLRADQGQ